MCVEVNSVLVFENPNRPKTEKKLDTRMPTLTSYDLSACVEYLPAAAYLAFFFNLVGVDEFI